MALELTIPQTQPAEINKYYPPQQGDWTYEDYARLPDNGFRYEVIRGELHMSPSPTPKHQNAVSRLSMRMYQFVEEHKLGELFVSPIDVIIENLATPVQPDLLFIRQDNLDIIKEKYIEGVPDLIVEVLSPSTARYDRQQKFNLYVEAGVTEYWLIDPVARLVDVYVLRGAAYAHLGQFGSEDTVHSEVLDGFTVAVQNIFTI